MSRPVSSNGTENWNKFVIRRVFQGYGAEFSLFCLELLSNSTHKRSYIMDLLDGATILNRTEVPKLSGGSAVCQHSTEES